MAASDMRKATKHEMFFMLGELGDMDVSVHSWNFLMTSLKTFKSSEELINIGEKK